MYILLRLNSLLFVNNELLYLTTINYKPSPNTDMLRLTTGIRSEKCVVRQFRRCAYVEI
jgi:hypothetical protein